MLRIYPGQDRIGYDRWPIAKSHQKKWEGLKDNIKELQQNPNEKGEGEDWKEKPK